MNAELRANLIFQHIPLVESIARRFLFKSHGEPLEDLVQVGAIGLIKAVDRYNPAKQVQFNTFATHEITGEIRHYLRDKINLIKQPRWLHYLNYRVFSESEHLAQELGRFPSPKEIAERLNIEEDGVLAVLQINEMLSRRTLDEHEDNPFEALQSKIRSRHLVSFQLPIEDKIVLSTAMQKLMDLERQVIYLFFYYDLTQSEIGKRVGLSQRSVSRVLEKGLHQLKEILTADVW